MANTLVAYCKIPQVMLGLTNLIVRQCGGLCIKPLGVRHLYSSTTLGIDGYITQKDRTKVQLSNVSSRFKEKMHEYTSHESKNMVFTEDLKNMLHLAEGDDDVLLIIKMMKRFNQQNKQMRFGSFIFGPVVMRMFHFLNKPQEAYECFKDEDLNGMFDQLISYQILLDLLYENQRYEDVLEVFQLIKNKQIAGIKFAKNVIVIVYGACYKLNTKESLQYALDLWTELSTVGHYPMRRAITFCAALAIEQGEPAAALEILSTSKNVNYTTVRNLKASALIDIGRTEDAINVLKSIITEDKALIGPAQTFNSDILDKAKVAVEKLGNNDIQLEFTRVLKYFQEQGHISEMTLSEQLCQEISIPPMIGKKVYDNPKFSRFNRNPTDNNTSHYDRTVAGRFSRPGLGEMQ